MTLGWFAYALLGAVCFSALFFVMKYLGAMGYSEVSILTAIFVIGSVAFIAHHLIVREQLPMGTKAVLLLIIAGVCVYLGNLFFTRSLLRAPNPGYTVAVDASKVVLTTVGAVLLFSNKVTGLKILGMALILVGIVLLGL